MSAQLYPESRPGFNALPPPIPTWPKIGQLVHVYIVSGFLLCSNRNMT